MKTIEFCKKYKPCEDGRKFALKHETMREVWEKCERTDWLFWILRKHKPLEQKQSAALAIAFAEIFLKYVAEGEDRPRLAIEAAKTWLKNPNEENRATAFDAAFDSVDFDSVDFDSVYFDAAFDAAFDSAAFDSADFDSADAARAAAAYAAYVAYAAADADANQCDMMRGIIPNPF